MIQLTTSRCLQGCNFPHVSLDFGVWGKSISGACGGPYGPGTPIDHWKQPVRVRMKIQQAIAKAISCGEIDRNEGERFLDEVYAGGAL